MHFVISLYVRRVDIFPEVGGSCVTVWNKQLWSGVVCFCFLSSQSDTGLCCRSIDTGLMHCTVWLFTPQLLLVLIVLGGMARLS